MSEAAGDQVPAIPRWPAGLAESLIEVSQGQLVPPLPARDLPDNEQDQAERARIGNFTTQTKALLQHIRGLLLGSQNPQVATERRE